MPSSRQRANCPFQSKAASTSRKLNAQTDGYALHGGIAADYTDMVYAATLVEVEGCRKAFIGDDFNQTSVRHAICAKDVGGRLKRLKHITAKERDRPLARSHMLDI